MQNEIKNTRLSFCCQEDWNGFKTVDKRTRFCSSCKHQVVDFTNASQNEFNDALNSGKSICGRFKRSQVSESFLKLAVASLAVTASVASVSCTENSIEPHPPLQTNPIKTVETEDTTVILMGMVAFHDSVTDRIKLPGVVSDTGEQKSKDAQKK
jgi:hypothetical protein